MSRERRELIELASKGAAVRNSALFGCVALLILSLIGTFIKTGFNAGHDFGNQVILSGLAAAMLATIAWNGSRFAGLALCLFFPLCMIGALVDPPPQSTSPFDILYIMALIGGLVWAVILVRDQFAYHGFLRRFHRPIAGSQAIRDGGSVFVILILVFGAIVHLNIGPASPYQLKPGGLPQDEFIDPTPDVAIAVLRLDGVITEAANVEALSFSKILPGERDGAIIVDDEVLFWWPEYTGAGTPVEQKFARIELGKICDFGAGAELAIPVDPSNFSDRLIVRKISGLGDNTEAIFRYRTARDSGRRFLQRLTEMNNRRITGGTRLACAIKALPEDWQDAPQSPVEAN